MNVDFRHILDLSILMNWQICFIHAKENLLVLNLSCQCVTVCWWSHLMHGRRSGDRTFIWVRFCSDIRGDSQAVDCGRCCILPAVPLLMPCAGSSALSWGVYIPGGTTHWRGRKASGKRFQMKYKVSCRFCITKWSGRKHLIITQYFPVFISTLTHCMGMWC